MSKGLEDVVGIFAVGIACRTVVTDGKGKGLAGVDFTQVVAHDGSTADLLGALPDDLGEVTPAVKKLHERASNTVQGGEEAHLLVVHQIGDHLTDVVSRDTVSDILTVSTTINRPV